MVARIFFNLLFAFGVSFPIKSLAIIKLPLTSTTNQKDLTLTVGVYDFAPHAFSSNGVNTAGALIDYLMLNLKNIGPYTKIDFKYLPFPRVLSDLEVGRIDLAVPLAKTTERQKIFLYTSSPLFVTSPGVILRKKDALDSVLNLNQLRGKTLGHLSGSVTPAFLKDHNIKIEYIAGADHLQRNLQKLSTFRIDGIFIPTYSNGLYVLEQNQHSKEYKILELPVNPLELYIVARKTFPINELKNLDKALLNSRMAYSRFVKNYVAKNENSQTGTSNSRH